MLSSEVIADILAAAKKALTEKPVTITGGWSENPTSGRAYQAASFQRDGRTWAVCRGVQRPAYARLLDATAGYMRYLGAERSIALLDPPANGPGKDLPAAEYRARFRAAAWEGLRVLWVAAGEEHEPLSEEPLSAPAFLNVADLIEQAVRGASSAWATVGDSREGERLIREQVGKTLADLGFRPAPTTFSSYWREGIADGAWERAGSAPLRLALEVKLHEDAEAPFGQIVDDLGAFDGVIHVRLVLKEAVRRRIAEVRGLVDAYKEMESLPVRFIHVVYCAICSVPVEVQKLNYPYLVCHACGKKAVNIAGKPPESDSASDSGENPVFIDGQQCWRRYRFGGYITMRDPDNLASLEAFYAKNKAP